MRNRFQANPMASRKSPSFKAYRPHFELLEDRILLSTFQWNVDTDGFWDDADNWLDELGNTGIPGVGDDVIINRAAADPTITVRAAQRVSTLLSEESINITAGSLRVDSISTINGAITIDGGELRGQAGLTAAGQVNWIDGVITGAVINSGTATISGTTVKQIFGTLTNEGTVTYTSTGNLITGNGGGVVNQTGALWDFQSDADVTDEAFSPTFINRGTVRKSGGTDVTQFVGNNNNFVHDGGRIEVQSGTLALSRSNPASTGATFQVDAGAVLDLIGPTTSTYTGTYTGIGDGRIELSGGTLSTTGVGAIFDMVPGLFHWTGGSITSNSTRPFTNIGSITLSGENAKRNNGVIRNEGTIIHSGTGDLIAGNGGTVENQVGALWDFQSDADVTDEAFSPTFINRGTVRKSGGTDETLFTGNNSNFIHDGGRIEVQSGKLALSRSNPLSTGATFQVDAGAVLDLISSTTSTYTGTYTGTGAGRIELAGGRLNISDAILDMAQGLFHWTGGTISSSSSQPLVNQGFMTLSGPDAKTLLGILANEGTISHQGTGNLFGGIVDNRPGGLWDIQNTGGLERNNFFNAGILRKSQNSGEAVHQRTNSSFNNQGGRIEVEAGRLVLTPSGTNTGGHFQISAGAVLELNTLVQFDLAGTYTGSGAGMIELTGRFGGNEDDPARLDFPEGLFHWRDNGAGNSSGRFINEGFITLSGSGSPSHRGNFVNNGTVIQEDVDSFILFQTSEINNFGLWDIRTDSDIQIVDFGGIGSTFNNLGTIRKSGGLSTSRFFSNQGATSFLNNTGTIDVQSGVLELETRLVQLDNDGTLNGGTWQVGPFSTLNILDTGETIDILMNYGDILIEGVSSSLPSIENLALNAGLLEFQVGRDFSTVGDFTNGADRIDTEMIGVFHTPRIRQIGIAFDSDAGTVFIHNSNDGLIREFNPDGTLIGTPFLRPNASGVVGDLDYVAQELNLGGTVVPAGFLLFLNGDDGAEPAPILYALGRNTGAVLAQVELTNVPQGTPGVAYDPSRGTVFIMQSAGDIYEINPSDGSIVNTFPIAPDGAPSFSFVRGDIDVHGPSGNLYIVGDSGANGNETVIRELSPTGGFIRDVDLRFLVPGNHRSSADLSGLAIDDSSEEIWLLDESEGIFQFSPIESGVFGDLILGPGSTLTVNGDFTEISPDTTTIQIEGRPDSGEFGKIEVTNQANLLGRLNIERTGGFGPTEGDIYEIFTFAQRNGEFSEIGGLDPFFSVAIGDTNILLNGELTDISADIAVDVDGFTLPPTGEPGQDVSITYTVKHLSGSEFTDNWVDSIYLSKDIVFDPDDPLIGRVEHSGGLAVGGSYSETITAPLPGVIDGDYHVIVIADSRLVNADTDRENNKGTSVDRIGVEVPLLAFDTPFQGTIANGQDIYFRIDVPAGGDVRLSGKFSLPRQAELFVSYRELPTRSSFDFTAFDISELTRVIRLTNPQAGPYYVLLHGIEAAGVGQDFNLLAEEIVLEVEAVTPDVGSNRGVVTSTIVGAGFTIDSTVNLLDDSGASVRQASVDFVSSNILYATFDLDNFVAGDYDVQVVSSRGTATLTDGFTVAASSLLGQVEITISSPRQARTGREAATPVVVRYRNVGQSDITAPLIWVQAQEDNAQFRVGAASGGSGSGGGKVALPIRPPQPRQIDGPTALFLGINHNGPAGILSPGEGGEIELSFVPSGSTQFVAGEAISGALFNWAELKEDLRPLLLPDDAWDVIWENFLAEMGSTMGQFEAVIAQNATYLSQQGIYTSDVNELIGFELVQAGAFGAIAQRFHKGPFGRGFNFPFDIRAVPGEDGNVIIKYGPSARHFTLREDGSFLPAPGDFALLTAPDAGYRLRESDGTIFEFRADGRLSLIDDPNGNRLIARYSDDRLTSLVDSNGDTITYSYNAAGLISQVTDEVGRITRFEYDSENEHLTRITTPQGDITYEYVDAQTPAREHAIAAVLFVDGTSEFYEYDDRGRLTAHHKGNDSERLGFTYDATGGTTITDANGNTSRIFYDQFSRPVRFIDSLGQSIQFELDGDANVVSAIGPGGVQVTFEYDELGNLTSQVDPAGNESNLFAESEFGNLETYVDSRGNVIRYGYDEAGNLLTATYGDGNAERYTYDAGGNVTSVTNRRGQTVQYQYDSRDLLTSKLLPGDVTVDYGYDDHRNLVSAARSEGSFTSTILLEYDEVHLLKTITYPDGKFLEYEYDAHGRRTSMQDQDGFTVLYEYDQAGRLSRLADGDDSLIVSYTYDDAARLILETKGNGSTVDYVYDSAGQILSLTHRGPDTTILSQFDYTYDAAGRRTSLETAQGTTTYEYDPTGQLILVTLPDSSRIEYEYDAVGNRIAVDENGTRTSFTINDLNQYFSIGGHTLVYDADGNLVSKEGDAGTTTYSYDAEGQLLSVSTPTDTWEYSYDPLGNLSSTRKNDIETSYLLDPIYLAFDLPASGIGIEFNLEHIPDYSLVGISNIVARYGATEAETVRYVHGLGLESQIQSQGEVAHYQFDASGNTARLVGGTGQVVISYSQLPFGEPLDEFENVSNPFRFGGEFGVTTFENGVVYMRNRWYDPALGRFLSPDPLGIDAGDANLYRYVGNSPVNSADPTGLFLSELAVGFLTGEAPALITGAFAAGRFAFLNSAKASTLATAKTVLGRLTAFGIATNAFNQVTAVAAISYGVTRVISKYSGFDDFLVNKWAPVFANGAYQDSLGPLGNPAFGENGRRIIRDCLSGKLPPEVCDRILFNLTSTRTSTVFSSDPNEIIGPAGFGPEGFIPSDNRFDYTINFENKAEATAPAQEVFITTRIDNDLDLDTFQLGRFGFGETTVEVPPGFDFYTTRVDLRESVGLFVDFTAELDRATRIVDFSLIAVDPLAGFLPPNLTSPEGEGFVTFSLFPSAGLLTGTEIDAQASIIFDVNEPIITNTHRNTIDDTPPASSINPLPAETNSESFIVSWAGDDGIGSGIASFNIFVSTDGGPFEVWLEDIADLAAEFQGEFGKTYSFFSVATDNVGFEEISAGVAQAMTMLVASVGTPTESFVIGLYVDLLNRTPDASGLAHWDGLLNNGGTRLEISQAIWNSSEHRGLQVDHFYMTYLDRLSDAGGRAHWVSELQNGMTEAEVQREFILSLEFSQTHGGGDASADDVEFVDALYQLILDRTGDGPGRTHWTDRLADGKSRTNLVDFFQNSDEKRTKVLDCFYEEFLDRDVADDELNNLLEATLAGSSLADAAQGLLASDEYAQFVLENSPVFEQRCY